MNREQMPEHNCGKQAPSIHMCFEQKLLTIAHLSSSSEAAV